jgi:subtilisin family serine protease
MKRPSHFIVLGYLLAFILVITSADANEAIRVDPELLAAFDRLGEDARLSINIILEEQLEAQALLATTREMSREVRRRIVVDELKTLSKNSQADLLAYLKEKEEQEEVSDISSLWILNGVNITTSNEVVSELNRRGDIAWIGYNKRVYALIGLSGQRERYGPVDDEISLSGAGGTFEPIAYDTAWGVQWIGAPAAWQMGYKGRNVIVAILDTGIWYYHTDLENRIWWNADEISGDGIDNDDNGYVDDIHGFDFDQNDPDPSESGMGHGTHVSGTVAGDGSAGTLTGVAPEATLIACKVLDDWGYGEEWNAWEGIEYAVDNGAHILQGSIGWIHEVHDPDRDEWRRTCDNVLAAGAIMSFAAGNERGWFSPPDDIRTPGDCPSPWLHPDQTLTGGLSAILSVGATAYHSDSYAYFSSVGPVTWEDVPPFNDYPFDPEMGLIKPDICAPGEGINSTVVGGGYSGDTWDGTSMATPHNSGVLALMLSKNLAMPPALIDSIIETTAFDLGTAGKDNDYGSGRIRADMALNATPELAGVTLTIMTPDSIVAQGGMLNVHVAMENIRPTPLTFDFWIGARTPRGSIIEVLPPSSHTLGGYESMTDDYLFPIRESLPAGNYRVVGIVGGYPSQVMDRDRIFVTVISSAPW